ncbi:MAG: TolC family protein [Candidatus Omnitrophota bacterium]|nr:MAG: TolC family protein [Candidatus Omnitrophota bacterium]
MRIIFILIFLFIFSINAAAEEELTWEDCLKEARRNHPDLISAREQLNQAVADKVIAKSDALPQIDSALSGATAKAASGATTDTYAYSVSAEQLLFDGFKTSYDISSADEDVKSARYNYEVTSSNVRLSLKEAFVELLKAQELLGITESTAQRRKQNLELVRLRYEAGREHRGSLLNAEANLGQAEFEVIQARRNVDLAQRQLTNELGRSKLTPIKAKGDFKVEYPNRQRPDFDYLAQSNPFLLDLMSRKESARFDLKSAEAEFLPEVYANASAGRSDSHWPPHNDVWSAGVSLSLPVFEGGNRIAQVSKAKAAFNQAQADERSGKDSVIFTMEDTWKGWQDAIDKVKVEEKFLEAAEERAKIAQAQYAIGLISFDDWSIIEDNLASAKKTLLDTKADTLVKEAEWVQAKGGTLDYVKK